MERQEYGSMYSLEDTYWWYQGLHALVIGMLKKYRVDGPVLDAGCGTGRLLELLRRRWTAEGFDLSEDAVAFSRRRGLTDVRQADLTTVSLPENHFGAITSMDVLYMLTVEDAEAVMRKFFAALKPGGALLMNLPAFEFLRRHHDRVVHTRHRYRRPELKRTLERIGFRVERATYRLPPLFFHLAVKKVTEPLMREEPRSDLQPLPKALNAALLACHRVENALLLNGISLPVGSSVFIVAVKP